MTAPDRSARLPAMDAVLPLDLWHPLLDALGHHPLVATEGGRRSLLASLPPDLHREPERATT